MTTNPPLQLGAEVAEARAAGRPLVALESTIIAHGMPYPRNVETALRVEETIRAAGATPATIAVLDGQLCAGLTPDTIDRIGRAGPSVRKLSRRDLPYALLRGELGATTVAATMIIAELAGIRLFATGGIGGVHRGAQRTFDISADLEELGRTSVAVVSAGAKSILDIGLTLEYLETKGVPVIGYQTDRFPAFYARESAFGVDFRLDTPEDVAGLLRKKWEMGLAGGVLIANPVPRAYAQDPEDIEAVIEQALDDASAQGIHGKALTPFLLARIEELTEGESLDSNIELVLNNARLAAAVAIAFSA
jgi:pseudouridine-5'-phosphate glycosidase